MIKTDIKKGSVVYHKSSLNLRMVVTEVWVTEPSDYTSILKRMFANVPFHLAGMCDCEWLDRRGHCRASRFNIESLVLSKENIRYDKNN